MLTVLSIQSALAFQLQTTDAGDPLVWDQMPVGYSWLDEGSPDLKHVDQAIESAFDAWTRVPHTDIEVRDEGLSGPREVAMDDVDAVFFDPDWPWTDAVALAATWSDLEGRVVAFDIHIDPDADWATDGRKDGLDLQAAITHEVGHVLGLDHSAQLDATMYATLGPGEDFRRVLSDDDREGASFLYAHDPDSGEPIASGVPLGCSSAGGSPAGWLTLLSLLLVVVPGRARSATLTGPVDLETLARDSRAIVEGSVVEARTERAAVGLRTVYTVAVERVVAGTCESLVEVTLPGGVEGDRVYRAAGVPLWSEGDEVVLLMPAQGPPGLAGVLTLVDRRPVDLLGRATPATVDELGRYSSAISQLPRVP